MSGYRQPHSARFRAGRSSRFAGWQAHNSPVIIEHKRFLNENVINQALVPGGQVVKVPFSHNIEVYSPSTVANEILTVVAAAG